MLLEEVFGRDKEIIYQEAIETLQEKTNITNFNQGGLARSILEIFSDELELAYEKSVQTALFGLISKSEGVWLDELGKLLDCERNPGESDDNFKYRIIHQNQSLAAANKMAIKLACLNVPGVNDVEFRKYVRGTGSFDVYVITDDLESSEEIFEEVQEKINTIQAYGNDGKVAKPRIIPIQLSSTLVFEEGINDDKKKNIRRSAKEAVIDYINNQRLEGEIIITQLINEIMSISDDVHNMIIEEIYVDNKQVFIQDLYFNWDERIVAQNIIIS